MRLASRDNMRLIVYILSVLYISLYILKHNGIYIPLISDYLIDLICIPLVLGWIKMFTDKLSIQNFQWGILPIVIAVIYFSIVFEFIMPNFSDQYTQDYWDILFYTIGGIIFYYLIKDSSTTFQHQANC